MDGMKVVRVRREINACGGDFLVATVRMRLNYSRSTIQVRSDQNKHQPRRGSQTHRPCRAVGVLEAVDGWKVAGCVG